ncbi:GxxExxY protein [Flavobacterium jejuense]|uniref:GxxExxY protein n=1 Tax=Flavobacterium jejuense TaxID=1544455 RepID=A0ABX0IUE8_9FLAO|nr:GxxExxY protein [Flavobacterium jejuense]NHN26427.1 GxxExxY protein [Flavobacterium jejuense]
MDGFYLKDETYKIIRICMEVPKILGKGHSGVVYKDALEYEFKINNIHFEREQIYKIEYKDFFNQENILLILEKTNLKNKCIIL